MALAKVCASVDAEVSRVLSRGRENSLAHYGRSPRLTFDYSSTYNLPQFLQIDSICWPPAIEELLSTVQSHSQMGYFSELQRTWLSIDNKLLLWNHVTGRDLCIFGGFSQLVVAVGEPVRPKPGVFRECISRIIPVASCDVVSLVGVQQKVEQNGAVSETRLVDLDFTVAAPCMLVKFATDAATGCIFAAGVDGQVYQLHYHRAATVLYPRMSLVAASASGVIRSSYNFIVSTLKGTLGAKATAPLVDVCYDARNQMVFALDTTNTIFGFERHGANLNESFKYVYDSSRGSGASNVGSPLVALHVGGAVGTLVAVTEGGERIIFKVSSDAWTATSSLQESGDSFPSPLLPHHIATRSWYSEGIFAASSVDASNLKAADAVAFVCDGVQGEASVGFRAPAGISSCLRVEHICEVETPSPYSETIHQVISAPRQLLLIHRKGISIFMRLRPVDVLHLILDLPKEERERRLAQFSSKCSTQELCVMLAQIASRSHNCGAFSQRSSSLISNSSLDQAARCLLNGPSSDTSRQAVDALRKYCLPTIEEKIRGSTRDITVSFSPFVTGSLIYMSRLLIPIWNVSPFLLNDNGLTSAHIQRMRTAESALGKFISYLECCQGELWQLDSRSSGLSMLDVAWDRTSAKIEIPQTAMFVASNDSKAIQSSFIKTMLEFSRAASQVLSFFLVCGRFELRVIEYFGNELSASKEFNTDIKSTVGKFIMNRGDARKVARFVTKSVVQSSSVCPKEVTLLFEEMERDSPYLFDAEDKEEYETILQFTNVLERTNLSEASVQQVLSRTAGIAVSLYRSGALTPLIGRLQQMNLHREAISLCLFAAAQLDGSLEDWEKLVINVTAMLERLYEYDRHVFNGIVGTPQSSGTMWYARPQDTRTHLYLLAWLAEKRSDQALTNLLQGTLVKVPSPELEGFLCRNIHELGLVYAEYLARVKSDFRAAVEVCSRLLQDPLLHIQSSERLAYRLQSARKAVECALEGSTAQRTGAEHAMEALLLQTKLMGIVQRFLTSGSRALDEIVPDNSGRTQRDLAKQHLELIQSEIVSQEKIFFLALNYEVMDDALEVAMEALCLNRTFDAVIVSRLLQRIISPQRSLADVSRFVQRFGRRTGFPVVSLILLAEHHQHSKAPTGSPAVPTMLLESGLEFDAVFNGYTEIIERRSVQMFTALGIEGRLSDAYLLHSQACLVQASARRVLGVDRFASAVRSSLDRLSRTASQQDRAILEGVARILDSI